MLATRAIELDAILLYYIARSTLTVSSRLPD